MGRHRNEYPDTKEHRRHARPSHIGGGALVGTARAEQAHSRRRRRHEGLHESAGRIATHTARDQQHDPAESAASFWHGMSEQNKYSASKERRIKNLFDEGVHRLVVDGRKYDRRVLARLPAARMTPVWDDHGDAELGRAKGMVDTFGRYISLRSLDDDHVPIHELAHRILRMGKKVYRRDERTGRIVHSHNRYSLYHEPIAEHLALDVMRVMEITPEDDHEYYNPHAHVLNKTLQIGRTSFKELTAMASGNDLETNYELFRTTIWERAGWDVVGFVDDAYWSALNVGGPGNDTYDVARRIDSTLSRFVPQPPSFENAA